MQENRERYARRHHVYPTRLVSMNANQFCVSGHRVVCYEMSATEGAYSVSALRWANAATA